MKKCEMGKPPELNIDPRIQIDNLTWVLHWAHKDNEMLREEIENLEMQAKTHYLRCAELERELIVLRNDRDCIQESLDEFGSDTVEVIELPIQDRLTMEEMKVYRKGVEVINNGREFTEDEIAFLHSLPAIPITRQEVQEIALNLMEEALRDILER